MSPSFFNLYIYIYKYFYESRNFKIKILFIFFVDGIIFKKNLFSISYQLSYLKTPGTANVTKSFLYFRILFHNIHKCLHVYIQIYKF